MSKQDKGPRTPRAPRAMGQFSAAEDDSNTGPTIVGAQPPKRRRTQVNVPVGMERVLYLAATKEDTMKQNTMKHAVIIGHAAVLLAVFVPVHAGADILFWDVVAQCKENADDSATLKMTCRRELDCVNRARQLYGCGGACDGPHLLAESIAWTEQSCRCSELAGMGETITCAEASQPGNERFSYCNLEATATVPVSCADMANYKTLCSDLTCPTVEYTGISPEGDFEIRGGQYPDACASWLTFSSPSPPTPSGTCGERVDSGGCSISVRNAQLSLLTILGLAVCICMLAARRRSR